jgi:tricarballylate dehydrogenase
MATNPRVVVVIGHGAAGLSAALAAAEEARRRDIAVNVTLLEKAEESDAGGNTRWSPSYMRMASPDRVEPGFVHDMLEATQLQGDETYFARLAAEAPATVAWIRGHGVEFHQPTYYLAKGPPRIQPVGGGPAIVDALARAAKQAGVVIRYSSPAQGLVRDGVRIRGVEIAGEGAARFVAADAVVLATGGFAANPDMMREHFGPGADGIRLISPGTRFATGDGIRMALSEGADRSGDWNGMHIEPVDPRSRNSAPVVLVYPYGIVVDKTGRRFFDEGGGLVHETWEVFSRGLHFDIVGQEAYAIFDRRLFDIPDWQRAVRSEVPPYQAPTLRELAAKIGVNAQGLVDTVTSYDAAASGDVARFDATRCDGLAASRDLKPPKSNWARPIVEPPFLAYPLIGAIAYTFGGLATDDRARVLRGSMPMPGLYAAGEVTGHFYKTAPNAVSVLRAFVFGRRAGLEAVEFLQSGTR